jgi:serine/threonine-protein kinase haspin
MALAAAEEACEFEHRDLHWGNLMLRPAATLEASFTLR